MEPGSAELSLIAMRSMPPASSNPTKPIWSAAKLGVTDPSRSAPRYADTCMESGTFDDRYMPTRCLGTLNVKPVPHVPEQPHVAPTAPSPAAVALTGSVAP